MATGETCPIVLEYYRENMISNVKLYSKSVSKARVRQWLGQETSKSDLAAVKLALNDISIHCSCCVMLLILVGWIFY